MDSLVDEEDEEEEVEAEAGAEEDPADAAATRGAHARCRGCDAPLEQRCAARGARRRPATDAADTSAHEADARDAEVHHNPADGAATSPAASGSYPSESAA